MKITEHDGRTYFDGWAGLGLFFEERQPIGGPKASIILLHGYAEHSGRYDGVMNLLRADGFAVFSYDQRGHGRSEGIRADVVRFTDYVRDLATFVDYVRERSPGKKIFVVAHSTGAAAAVLYAVSAIGGAEIDGLVTSGIYIRDAGEYEKWKTTLGRVLVNFAPLMPIQELDPTRIAENSGVCDAYREDPLVYHGGARIRMGIHLIDMESYLREAIEKISIPLLLLHGAKDQLASIESSRMLYESAASTDKQLEILEGVGHEVLHDFRWEETIRTVSAWLDAHL